MKKSRRKKTMATQKEQRRGRTSCSSCATTSAGVISRAMEGASQPLGSTSSPARASASTTIRSRRSEWTLTYEDVETFTTGRLRKFWLNRLSVKQGQSRLPDHAPDGRFGDFLRSSIGKPWASDRIFEPRRGNGGVFTCNSVPCLASR
jgi:hypothetical protein